MCSNTEAHKILDLLKGKFIAILRLIYKIRNLEEFDIYININHLKYVSLLADSTEEIEEIDEAQLLTYIESNPFCFKKTEGNFQIVITYRGDDEIISNDEMITIKEISLELLDLVSQEAIDLQKRVMEESKVEALRIKSQHDGLTGLYNRETFDQLYNKIYKKTQEEKSDFSILMIDIDNFKQINDCYGHQFGDRVLKNVADKIKQNVRKDDVVARYGGEEMIIILINIDQAEAKVIAERIRTSIANLKTEGVTVTISIGASNFKKDIPTDQDRLIYVADKCLYEAKTLGKNRVMCK
ncbi:GGDEF domain-containing protein [Alkaliphilus transvaalensis]|uniref:GGDEF domain-containing protein n=1 Tax=Alkaliphilus transvaalensis TaxID=114628 RepID=UPI000554F87E|nr:GGDEF domain-containing protein [Alkaliphilus transvaalensis]